MSARKPPGEKVERVVFYAPPKLARWIRATRKGKTVSERVLDLVHEGAMTEAARRSGA